MHALTERFNEACNFASKRAQEEEAFRAFDLHAVCYAEMRSTFGLAAQLCIRAIAKVAASYADYKKRKTLSKFRLNGSVDFDQRVLSFKKGNTVSLSTLGGRALVPFTMGNYQQLRWANKKGQSKLVFRDGEFYLYISQTEDEEEAYRADAFIGVDLGIVNIATTSTGSVYSGEQVERVRRSRAILRAALQSKGTKSAKRHLKKISKKESRFKKDLNHCIAKKLVENAERSRSAIVLEDLTGIRRSALRAKARRSLRAKLGNWSFYELRFFVEYKAKRAGVPVYIVDPAYTSQTCHKCGCIDKLSRQSQSEFVCTTCGHEANADVNAALNIAELGRQKSIKPRKRRKNSKAPSPAVSTGVSSGPVA